MALDGPATANQDLWRADAASIGLARVARARLWVERGGPVPPPVSVHLDLTFRCTAKCAHCSQWTWPDRPEMGLAQIEQLVAILGRWKVRTVTIGGGNPLLHPHLADLILGLNRVGARVALISEGGVALPPRSVATIDRAVAWVRFSLDGATARVHDGIRRAPGLFDSATVLIRQLRETSRTRLGLNFVIQRRNLDELVPMVHLARTLAVDALMFKLPHGDDPAHRYVPTGPEWAVVRERLAECILLAPDGVTTNLSRLAHLLDDELDPVDVAAGRPVRSLCRDRQTRCFVPLFFLVIDPQGNVYPCDYLQADTRPSTAQFLSMRARFQAGNVFVDGDGVLDRLSRMLRETVHVLPRGGYEECGSCTRFFQLNDALTEGSTLASTRPGPSDHGGPFL